MATKGSVSKDAVDAAFNEMCERFGLPKATEPGEIGYSWSPGPGATVVIQSVEEGDEEGVVRQPFVRVGPMKRAEFLGAIAFSRKCLELMLRHGKPETTDKK